MATICPNCGSADTQAGFSNTQCLNCGRLADAHGNPTEVGMDQSTRAALEARMAPRKTVVGGNLADLQRAGAEAAVHNTGPLADTTPLPPGTEKEDAVTPAEDDAARGLVTTETVRTGDADSILEAQAEAAVPAEETDKARFTNTVPTGDRSPLAVTDVQTGKAVTSDSKGRGNKGGETSKG